MVFYLPIFGISLALAFRHGFRREAGWVFLCIFALTRIIGGAMMVAAELIQPVNITLYIIGFILEAAGLSPLLMATLGFLRTVGQNSSGNSGQSVRVFRILGLIGMAGLGLAIYGGSTANDTDPQKLKNSNTFRHIGTILFLILYLLIAFLHVVYWFQFRSLMKHRRTLLVAISCALPFLGIRMLYAVLSTFSGSLVATPSSPTNTNSLSKFNMATGDWRIYLVMSVIMECIVAVIYTVAGARLPLNEDYLVDASGSQGDAQPLYGAQAQTMQAYYPQGQTTYAPPGPYGSQTPYQTEEHLAYGPPRAQAYAPKQYLA
jgi:hypothetical protein